MGGEKQFGHAALQARLDSLRIEDALLLTDITDGREGADFEITGFMHRSALARMRNGCSSNLILRGDVLILSLYAAGVPRAKAERVIAHWTSVMTEVYADDLPTFPEAVVAEQASDCDEDWAGVQALLDREKHSDIWIAELERYIGHANTLLTVLRRDKTERRQIARAA